MANKFLITNESLKTILPVYENKILEQVKNNISKVVEPAVDDIPSIFFSGEMPTNKKYVSIEMDYHSKTEKFHAYLFAKIQGASTTIYPKKNLSIIMYKDKNRIVEFNREFKNWGAHNNFVLKADYNDILHARNVVCAKLWSDVVASRSDYDNLPEGLKNSPNNGTIDGFPVKVYVNGEYQGLYSWTIPKSAWMFGMDEKNKDHVVLAAQFNDNGDPDYEFNPCNFNALWDGNEDYFEAEVGEINESVINKINNIIMALDSYDTCWLE